MRTAAYTVHLTDPCPDSRVIEDLLLRKVGAPERHVRQDDVDLLDIVVDVLGLTSISARSKLLDVTIAQPAHPVIALGNREDLDKVVLNLVSNAVKYTPEGRRVQIALSSYDDQVELSVTNPQAVAQPSPAPASASASRSSSGSSSATRATSVCGRTWAAAAPSPCGCRRHGTPASPWTRYSRPAP